MNGDEISTDPIAQAIKSIDSTLTPDPPIASMVVDPRPVIVSRIAAQRTQAKHYYDWSGGLVWLALPMSIDADHHVVRGAIGPGGGHALLVRAPADVRAQVPVFQPPAAALSALTSRVKESFDPRGLFNPGRMG